MFVIRMGEKYSGTHELFITSELTVDNNFE